VFNSNWVRDSFPEYRGPSTVIYPPVEPEEYRATPGDSVLLVNISKEKGSDVFYALAEAYPEIDFLGVIGGYGEQDLRPMPNVTISTTIDDMRHIYGRTKVVLMPSSYESFGRCAIEAAASGIPTIAAPRPGLMEALGYAGTYCDDDDLASWRFQLGRLLTPGVWREFSQRSLARSAELAQQAREHLLLWCEVVDSFAGVRGAA
jgi:glycosyltransferase involved in cell wall biosynthesis